MRFLKRAQDKVVKKNEPITKENTNNFNMKILGTYRFKNADTFIGTIPITDKIDAAVIRLYPPGTLDKMFKKKPIQVSMDEMKGDILEISTNVKNDYKELGVGSKWGDITKRYYPKLHEINELKDEAISDKICEFVLLSSPKMIIDFNDELVYSYFKSKFNGVIVSKNSSIKLNIAQQHLPFTVLYVEPEENAKIDDKTDISFLFPTDISGKSVSIAMSPISKDIYREDVNSKLSKMKILFDILS